MEKKTEGTKKNWKKIGIAGAALFLLLIAGTLAAIQTGVLRNGKDDNNHSEITLAMCLSSHPTAVLKIDTEKLTIERGTEYVIHGTIMSVGIDPDEVEIYYESNDPDRVSVSSAGIISANQIGTAEVKIYTTFEEQTCTVDVIASMSDMQIDQKNSSLEIGKTKQLTAVITPADTTDDMTVIWSSSNPEVVSVNETGLVTAVGEGEAEISAVCGTFKDTCKISVDIPVRSVELNKTELTLEKGNSESLTANVEPDNTTHDKTVRWSTGDSSIVIVDDSGKVTAVGAGTTTVTAACDGIEATCSVRVTSAMTGIRLAKEAVTLTEGDSTTIGIDYFPYDTTDSRAGTWYYDSSIISVTSDGTVKALKAGSCELKLTVGVFQSSCQITVNPYIKVNSVWISKTSVYLDESNPTCTLSAGYEPQNATRASITWSSSNPKVAKVSETGKVTGLKSGTTVITATAGGKSESCTVTVDLPTPKAVICLDPGHGGPYSGTTYGNILEKDLTLKIANYCKEYLEENYPGVQVILTRTTDIQLNDDSVQELIDRVMVGVNAGADVFVSLHLDAVSGGSQAAHGCSALVSKQPNIHAESVKLSNCILNQLQKLGIYSRGCITRDDDEGYIDENGVPLDYYSINRNSAKYGQIGIIIEHCYMTDADKQYWYGEEALKKLGIADAIGIAEYLGL